MIDKQIFGKVNKNFTTMLLAGIAQKSGNSCKYSSIK